MTPPLATALALVVAAVLAGCTGDAGSDPGAATTPTASSTGPRVLQPGLPGEPAVEVSDPTPAPRPPHTDADVTFARGMVVHHAQALEMAALAPGRAAFPKVAMLAERILAAQAPEIAVMGQWLADRDALDAATAEVVAATTELDLPASDGDEHAGHGTGHGGAHAGMATGAEMSRLRDARGADFDRLFLTLMTRHHQGALTMVDELIRDGGTDLQMEELAADVSATQSVEIDRMQELLRSL